MPVPSPVTSSAAQNNVPARLVARAVAPLLTLILAVAALLVPHPASGTHTPMSPVAKHKVLSAGASVAHPYSAPTWWPAATGGANGIHLGCYRSNPLCDTHHKVWMMDIVGTSFDNHQKVYAMGAGIVHVGALHTGCGQGGRGNYLMIDHGDGVVSYYGNIADRVLVHSGQYVSARTPIAYMGNTGNANCHINPGTRYVMVAVKHGSRYVDMDHFNACVNGQKRTWPQELPGSHWNTWNNTPKFTQIPNADASRSCVAATPHTANRPANVRLSRSNSTTLRAGWNRPSSAYHVRITRVTLEIYYKANHRWYIFRTHQKSGSSHATRFTHLKEHHHYRVHVEFSNWAGNSAPSRLAYRNTPHVHHHH